MATYVHLLAYALVASMCEVHSQRSAIELGMAKLSAGAQVLHYHSYRAYDSIYHQTITAPLLQSNTEVKRGP